MCGCLWYLFAFVGRTSSRFAGSVLQEFDGSLKSGDHQLIWYKYPIIYRVSAPFQVVGNGISGTHQQYHTQYLQVPHKSLPIPSRTWGVWKNHRTKSRPPRKMVQKQGLWPNGIIFLSSDVHQQVSTYITLSFLRGNRSWSGQMVHNISPLPRFPWKLRGPISLTKSPPPFGGKSVVWGRGEIWPEGLKKGHNVVNCKDSVKLTTR